MPHSLSLGVRRALFLWPHGSREAMGLMYHGIQDKHNAWDLNHPFPGGQIPQQMSPEHVIHGPVAAFVDGNALWVVRRGEDPLDP